MNESKNGPNMVAPIRIVRIASRLEDSPRLIIKSICPRPPVP